MEGHQTAVEHAWAELGDPRKVRDVVDISATVSTNRVFRVVLEGGDEVIAKSSSYGSYVHFRQDHALIHRWAHALGGTPYRDFLAPIITKQGEIFTYNERRRWVVFYQKAPFYDFLPKRLSDEMVRAFGEEMAALHRASTRAAEQMPPTWKSVGSDIATLYDFAGSDEWREERGFDAASEKLIRDQCDSFLKNAQALGYHGLSRIPLLLDWNIGNFSVGFDGQGFKLFSRWDYDWFRFEPRSLDFYFCARVVREEGDQELFSYLSDPLLEPRFMRFLKAYQAVFPLAESELLFIKEAYRFFILNYVVRGGEHFFRPSICRRLQKEAISRYLPLVDSLDLRPLVDQVLGREEPPRSGSTHTRNRE